MQQSVYEGLLTQGGSAPLLGTPSLGSGRIAGLQPMQAAFSIGTIWAGWEAHKRDYTTSGILLGMLGILGVIDSAY